MSSDLDELSYRMIESAIDRLDYVPPSQATIYVATYAAYSHDEEVKPPAKYDFVSRKLVQPPPVTKKKPGKWVTVPGEKKKRLVKFGIAYDSTPLPQADYDLVEKDEEVRHVTTIPRTWTASGQIKALHLHTTPRFADLVYDDVAELKACDFPWAETVASLTEEFRRDLFERNLHEQKEMPQAPVNGRKWLQQVAQYCTYDSNGDYYNKWKAGKPGPNRRHTEKYLEVVAANRQECLLVKGHVYMIVMAKDLPGVAYSLELDAKDGLVKRLVPHRMSAGLLWTLPSFKQNMSRQFDVYFVATPEGAGDESKGARKAGYHLKDKDQASYEVVDPRKLVAAAIGDEQLKNLHIAEDDEWKWFLQLVAHIFAEPYYVLDVAQAQNHPWVRSYGGIERLREEANKFIEKAWQQQGSEIGKPLRAASRRRLRAQMKDERFLVLPQGFPSARNTRFIGTDGHYAFDRDIENGFVYVFPNVEYMGGLAQKQFAADVYEDVAWLVPMMEVAAVLAGVAVGGFAMGARKFVIKRATKQVAKEIVKEAIKSVEPALVALLLDVVLDLITKPALKIYAALDSYEDDVLEASEQYVELWQEFLRGFCDGYIRLNIAGRVAKLQDMVMPAEAKAVLIATRLYELVQKFRAYLERIEGLLTDGAIARLLHNLEKSATHLVRGFASALGLLYYLDFETVKPFLEIFDVDEQAPSPDEWAAEVHEFFASITAKLEQAGNEAATLRDMFDFESTKPYVIAGAVGLGYVSFLTTGLKALSYKPGQKGGKKKYVIVGGLLLAYLAYEEKLDEAYGVAKELIFDMRHMFPGKDKRAAKLNGQLIGKLLGTFLVDKALFDPEKSTLGSRLAKRKALRIGVQGALGGSMVMSVLKVLFARYVHLADRLGSKVKFLHDDLKQFIADERAAQRGNLDKASMGHLNAFRAKSDEVMSFREMVSILVHLRDLMLRDKEAFERSMNEGVDEIRDDFKALNRVTTAAGFDLEKLADRELRAAMIQMNAHAYRALDEILKAIGALFDEIASDTSIMTVLQELGVDVGDLNKAHENIRNAIEPRMDGFKKKEEALKKKQADLDAKDKAAEDAKKEQMKKLMEGTPLRP